MGILASLGFVIFILWLGFVYNNWTLAFMILFAMMVFASLLAYSMLDEIKQNWNERRCDLEVMLTAQLYKPADDLRSGGEFASENFQFCTKKVFQQIIQVFLLPIYGLVGQQLNVTESLNEAMNGMRVLQANFLNGFLKILEPINKRFQNTGAEFVVTYHKFLMAVGRAMGITQAILYIGMTLSIAVENFVHLVINAVLVVMYIILGVMILLFPLILPVFGLIIYTCQVIGNSTFGYLSEDVCGELCFDPETKVCLLEGVVKRLHECQVGDILEDGGTIEGILYASGEKEPILVLDGIKVTGSHLVWLEEKQEWIAAAQHPSSALSFQRCSRLICLRTSNRNIPIRGLSKLWTFRDWEELPTNLPTSETIWDFLVSEILNQKPLHSNHVPKAHPLLKKSCQVMFKTGEQRSIAEVQIGDILYGSEGFTKVTGLYKGRSHFQQDQVLTDGVWIKHLDSKEWNHPQMQPGTAVEEEGFHLTTESGCFWVSTNQFSGFVRDFTEVGAHNLFLTYTYTRQLLKKSFSREESCVSDSLSQVLSSCSQPIS